jgi:hypothetical protein
MKKTMIIFMAMAVCLYSQAMYVAGGQLRLIGADSDDYIKVHDGAALWIDYAHNKVHVGSTWQTDYGWSTLANNGNATMALLTPTNRDLHIEMGVWAGGAGWITFYEAPIITNFTNANLVTCINHNRAGFSTNVCLTQVRANVLATNFGTALTYRYLAGGTSTQTRVGGSVREGSEFVLKPGTYYMLVFSNASGGAISVSFAKEWYEEIARY